jgi:hypothetical protein
VRDRLKEAVSQPIELDRQRSEPYSGENAPQLLSAEDELEREKEGTFKTLLSTGRKERDQDEGGSGKPMQMDKTSPRKPLKLSYLTVK